jgi:hypothetical protein
MYNGAVLLREWFVFGLVKRLIVFLGVKSMWGNVN